MEILTGRQMRRVDERAIRERRIPSLDLMEGAGAGVAAAMAEEIPGLVGRRVIVLCGKGNNGGDGFVVARHLAAQGASPEVVALAPPGELRGDAALNARRAQESGLQVLYLADERAWAAASLAPDARAVVVDAILGTGVSGGARGLSGVVIDAVGSWPATVVAVDLPSGADADSGRLDGPVVRAHRTYTLCRPKLCLVLEPAASHAGPFRVIDIGIPDDDVAGERANLEWLDIDAAARLRPVRPPDAHKGTMGHLLVIAGSRGKSGAAVLAGRAALRAGTGLVTVAVPRGVQLAVAASQAELMTEGLPESRGGTLSRSAAPRALALAASCSALALGPGLGTSSATRAAVMAILAGRRQPLVLDADGLNALATARSGVGRSSRRPPLVLTPHPGEAGRLLRMSVSEIQADRLAAARRLAASTGAVVVLKGRHSIVARPDGTAAFNASGNAGMAKGGTGDALTGIVGALLARRMDPFDAARLGTYVHGAAGDVAADRLGAEGMTAGDLIEALPEAWRALSARNREVGPWIRGV